MKTLSLRVRFWTYHAGGWVRLSLAVGQSLEHYHGGRTEEGYSYEITKWTHEGGRHTSAMGVWRS